MLTQEEVKKYAHMRRLKLIDQIWKDYLQDIALYLLYKKMPKMVFGGGTCLWKILKGNRFSEDIDAYSGEVPDDLADYIKREFFLLGFICKILKKKTTANMLFLNIGLSFPSHPREITISIEILLSMPTGIKNAVLYSPYPDIPPIEMTILSEEEMLANKVSAVYRRDKARDVYDIYFLLKIGTKVNYELLKKKVPNFNIESFKRKLLEKEKYWNGLEPLVIGNLPAFREEVDFILNIFRSEKYS